MDIEIPNYTLLKRLGEGSMAVVWLAEHKRNGRKAAMKVLRRGGQLSDPENEKLFLQEGRVLASFNDRNIVTIYDNDKVGDIAYLAMEYLPGGTLLERMQRETIAVGEAIGLVVQIASALGAMHRQGVVHRDLKPANIMLRDETTPVLTDFGAVRVVGGSTVYGKAGFIIGTREYMSPEQMLGGELDGRTDLYALGVVFYELLTGVRPFRGTPDEIASQHFYAPVPRLPEDLAVLQSTLDQLLAKKSADRFADTQAFIDDLRQSFIEEAALRRKIGFSASAAWSTQLRALGFVLDLQQKYEVRIAQGENLQAAEAVAPTPVRLPADQATSVTHALPRPVPIAVVEPGPRLPVDEVIALAVAKAEAAQNLAPSGGAEHFVQAGPGELRDLRTGLLWTQADNGADIDWQGAVDHFAGSPWRLPTVNELQAIYQSQMVAGSVRGFNCKVSRLFKLSSFWFWSASREGETEAWVVNLGHGHRHANGLDFKLNRRALGVRQAEAVPPAVDPTAHADG